MDKLARGDRGRRHPAAADPDDDGGDRRRSLSAGARDRSRRRRAQQHRHHARERHDHRHASSRCSSCRRSTCWWRAGAARLLHERDATSRDGCRNWRTAIMIGPGFVTRLLSSRRSSRRAASAADILAAQDTLQLTLDDAVRRAVEHNPDLAVVRLDTEVEARARRRSRGRVRAGVLDSAGPLEQRRRRRRTFCSATRASTPTTGSRRPACASACRGAAARGACRGTRRGRRRTIRSAASIRACSRGSSWRSRSRC